MDNNLDVSGLRTAAQTAGTDLTNTISGVPGMMATLKQSLASIYSKDNPLIQARDEALSKYMSTADQTRSDILTPNLPMVAGSPLTLSPTQQNAIVSSRQSAALAPLLGLNQAVTAGYGNIHDLVDAAAQDQNYRIKAAETKAANALNLYQNAISEYNAITARQKADQEAKQNSGYGSDFLAALSGLFGGNQGGGGNTGNGGWEVMGTPITFGQPGSYGPQPPVNLFTPGGGLIPGLSY